MNPLLEGLARHFTPCQLALLKRAHVGIAGSGGLGSNVAMLLCRSGIGQMTIIDYDMVEASNLNRQQFWPGQLGQPKVEALAAGLLALNSELKLNVLQKRLEEPALAQVLASAPLWVEAFDAASSKAMFVRAGLAGGKYVVAASGVCGFGGPPMQIRKLGRLTVVGDFCSDSQNLPPLAPRVTQAAAMMADAVLSHVLAPAGNHVRTQATGAVVL